MIHAGYNRRTVGGRTARKAFLIVCEGEKTEPLYFKAFKLSSVDVEGVGKNTRSLVEHAIRLKAEREGYDQYWCVFDRDSFSAQEFNAAIEKARNNDIRVAYSNEAFELWFLLHFNYFDTGLVRSQYKGKLTNLLGRPYEKNDPALFDALRTRQAQAIRNARKLLDSYGPDHNPEKNNPCTTVHELVEELNAQAAANSQERSRK